MLSVVWLVAFYGIIMMLILTKKMLTLDAYINIIRFYINYILESYYGYISIVQKHKLMVNIDALL